MPLDHLVGSTYGPFGVRVAAESVAAYVAATGDDAERWAKHAPPSYAGALLFVAAPAFLQSKEVAEYTRVLVHADQRFAWHRALGVDEEVSVAGELARVRGRGGLKFVTFEATVSSAEEAVVESTSTFIMGAEAPADPSPEQPEPPVTQRGMLDAASGSLPAGPGPIGPISRSASRLELVRYAAASGDFNPVHFDHETARAAGFSGVVTHGLLMGAWLLQVAAALSGRPDPIAEARLRFRNPLLPGIPARIEGRAAEPDAGLARVDLALSSADVECVSARIAVRAE